MDTSELIPKLEKAAPGAILEMRPFGRGEEVSVWIEMRAIAQVAAALKDDPSFGFDTLENLTVMEIDRALVFTYFLRSSVTHTTLIVRGTSVPAAAEAEADVPSVRTVWPMAVSLEWEAGELFGIRFTPELGANGSGRVRKLLPEGWVGYPLRKGYVFPTEFMDIRHERPAGHTGPDDYGVSH